MSILLSQTTANVSMVISLIVLFVFMYFFMIRPQQKEQKKKNAMLADLPGRYAARSRGIAVHSDSADCRGACP